MPSPKSREAGFYYAHPQNKFWRLLSDVFNEKLPENNREKKNFLSKHNIALWDVIESCNIEGADDSSIKDVKPNNISLILNAASIKAIFTTGKKATYLYKKLCYPETGFEAIELPSSSPANCRVKYEDLLKEYQKIREFC